MSTAQKTIWLCVQKDITDSMKWILKEFQDHITIKQAGSEEELRKAIGTEAADVLILDARGLDMPVLAFMNELHKQKENLDTILIISRSIEK